MNFRIGEAPNVYSTLGQVSGLHAVAFAFAPMVSQHRLPLQFLTAYVFMYASQKAQQSPTGCKGRALPCFDNVICEDLCITKSLTEDSQSCSVHPTKTAPVMHHLFLLNCLYQWPKLQDTQRVVLFLSHILCCKFQCHVGIAEFLPAPHTCQWEGMQANGHMGTTDGNSFVGIRL